MCLTKMRKIDYEKKAKRDAKVGKLGETLALSYEQNRLTDLGRPDLAQKVNLMEETAPAKYLSILQNGAKVAPSDLALLHDISLNYGLENSVINALVDYVLSMNDNVLSRPYVEKVAASLARQGVSSAYEAMEYLRSIAAKQRNPRNAKKTTAKLSIKESVNEEEEEEALSWDEIVGEANKKEDKEDELDPYGED